MWVVFFFSRRRRLLCQNLGWTIACSDQNFCSEVKNVMKTLRISFWTCRRKSFIFFWGNHWLFSRPGVSSDLRHFCEKSHPYHIVSPPCKILSYYPPQAKKLNQNHFFAEKRPLFIMSKQSFCTLWTENVSLSSLLCIQRQKDTNQQNGPTQKSSISTALFGAKNPHTKVTKSPTSPQEKVTTLENLLFEKSLVPICAWMQRYAFWAQKRDFKKAILEGPMQRIQPVLSFSIHA